MGSSCAILDLAHCRTLDKILPTLWNIGCAAWPIPLQQLMGLVSDRLVRSGGLCEGISPFSRGAILADQQEGASSK
jgi:hypothetical protein